MEDGSSYPKRRYERYGDEPNYYWVRIAEAT
jgi:hypothetical protein